MVEKYVMQPTETELKHFTTDAHSVLSNILFGVGNDQIFSLSSKRPDLSISARRSFFGTPVVDLEYSGEDATLRFARGYMTLASARGRIRRPYYSGAERWPDYETVRFTRTLDGNRRVSYGLRVDDSYLTCGNVPDSKYGDIFLCIVPEIAETTPTVLDGIATTSVSSRRIQDRFVRDKAKLLDAVHHFGFEVAGLKEPGGTARSGLYNVCLEPRVVDAEGLADFLNQALGLGLDTGFVVRHKSKGARGSLSATLKREEGVDYFGMSLRQLGLGFELSSYANCLFGLRDFMDAPISYLSRVKNPEWTERHEEARMRRKRVMGAVGDFFGGFATGCKWATVPLWGPFYGAVFGISHGVRSAKRSIGGRIDRSKVARREREQAEARRNERLSAHLRGEFGIPENKEYHETCVVGVTPEFMTHLSAELSRRES